MNFLRGLVAFQVLCSVILFFVGKNDSALWAMANAILLMLFVIDIRLMENQRD